MAMPIPPPMQRDATPLRPPVLWSACSRVTSTLQPDIPMGWPREIAPPLTFTWGVDKKVKCHLMCFFFFFLKQSVFKFAYNGLSEETHNHGSCSVSTMITLMIISWITLSAFRPSSLITAMDWAANASLISNKSTWSSCQPAFSTWQRMRPQINIKNFFPHRCRVKFYLLLTSHRFPDGWYWSGSHDGWVKTSLSTRYNSAHWFNATSRSLWLAH